MNEAIEFTTRNGETKFGYIVRIYHAFEGGMRFILRTDGGREYRCVRTSDFEFKEYVA